MPQLRSVALLACSIVVLLGAPGWQLSSGFEQPKDEAESADETVVDCPSEFEALLTDALSAEPVVVAATGAAHRIQSLRRPGSPQQRLDQLRALREDVRALVDVAEQPARLPALDELLAPCQTSATDRERQFVEARTQRLHATEWFDADRSKLELRPEARRLGEALDAFFELRLIREPPTGPCDLEEEHFDYTWDAGTVLELARTLQVVEKDGLLPQLNEIASSSSGPLGVALRALPLAACGKLTQALCVDLQRTRVPLSQQGWSKLARLRRRADSLKQAHASLRELERVSGELGCGADAFSLPAADRYARTLLDFASEELSASVDEWAQRIVQASAAPPTEGEPFVLAEQGLRSHRLELAALTLSVVEPASAYLTARGVDQPQAWQVLLEALRRSPELVQRTGASREDPSGLFAYEQFLGELLLAGSNRCDVALRPWNSQVFDVGHGLLHEQGARLSRAASANCDSSRRTR